MWPPILRNAESEKENPELSKATFAELKGADLAVQGVLRRNIQKSICNLVFSLTNVIRYSSLSLK